MFLAIAVGNGLIDCASCVVIGWAPRFSKLSIITCCSLDAVYTLSTGYSQMNSMLFSHPTSRPLQVLFTFLPYEERLDHLFIVFMHDHLNVLNLAAKINAHFDEIGTTSYNIVVIIYWSSHHWSSTDDDLALINWSWCLNPSGEVLVTWESSRKDYYPLGVVNSFKKLFYP